MALGTKWSRNGPLRFVTFSHSFHIYYHDAMDCIRRCQTADCISVECRRSICLGISPQFEHSLARLSELMIIQYSSQLHVSQLKIER